MAMLLGEASMADCRRSGLGYYAHDRWSFESMDLNNVSYDKPIDCTFAKLCDKC